MRKILLTGKNGQVGWELLRTLAPLGEIVSVGRSDMDLADPDSIRQCIRSIRPEMIVNAAAYTAVDKAESEPEIAMAVNGVAPGIMAEEARALGAVLVHYSTDYVYDGAKTEAYVEENAPNPLSVYGKTKLAGERAIQDAGVAYLIFRTSWVYGMRGKNFLLTILRLAQERDELRIVADQFGAPTWSRMIAEATSQVLAQCLSPQFAGGFSGVYHLTAGGKTSWHGFTQAILGNSGFENKPRLVPIATAEYPLPAARPQNSVMSNDKLYKTFNIKLPSWEESLLRCMENR